MYSFSLFPWHHFHWTGYSSLTSADKVITPTQTPGGGNTHQTIVLHHSMEDFKGYLYWATQLLLYAFCAGAQCTVILHKHTYTFVKMYLIYAIWVQAAS